MPTPPDPFPLDLTLACSRFSRLAARRADVGVSSVTWRVVAALGQRGELRVGEIAALEQVTRPTATTVVQRLEHEGVVVRRLDPADSRSSLVRLTDHGRERLATWRTKLGTEVGTLLADTSEEDRAVLHRAVELLGAIVAAEDLPMRGRDDPDQRPSRP
ncbi:MarR family winged helix-turn-helix transcriptional regulator [Brachybacterium sp. AOP25-B2-12]|uniref:MarR family winged helix-turn-helix transcriptional regulator n=1 Tax=Brachybacterium sp. AOP25-B2-12 TaxID=3457710 RepID=UPI0040340C6F